MNTSILNREKSQQEHAYTSTGIKFWRHPEEMISYKEKTGRTVISTHISPEGSCNLNCSYCSVSKRKRTNRIDLEVIKDYLTKLMTRGLKAVIITGGGEPTLYPSFNRLLRWINDQGLSTALITNGTNIEAVDEDVWQNFSWVRVSLNFVDGYKDRIRFPRIKGTLGASMVYVGQSISEMIELSEWLPESVEYVRVLPNCLLKQEDLLEEHSKIQSLLCDLGDKRFFQQFKVHGAPCSKLCHQAYFRPYLSEVDGGTVFPCDSLVLNEEQMHFSNEYAICKASEILDFMDGTIKMRFNAQQLCTGCVFTDNIKLLDDWLEKGINSFSSYDMEMKHEEFV